MYIAAITVLILFLLIGLVVLVVHRTQSGRKPNYRVLFILGIVWLPLGIIFQNLALWAPGLVFFIVGAANRKHWRESRWKDLTPKEKHLMFWAMGLLLLILAAGVGVYFLGP